MSAAQGHRLIELAFAFFVGMFFMYLAIRVFIASKVRAKVLEAIAYLDKEYAAKQVEVEERYAAMFVAKEAERSRLELKKTDPLGLQRLRALEAECRGKK
jgi:hypothetical protein